MSLRIKAAASETEIEGGFGHTLLELAQQAGVQANARCAGEGVCGGCTVILEAGQFVVANQRVTADPEQPCSVLACQTRLASHDARIRFPRTSIVEREAKIDEDFCLEHFQYDAQTCKFVIRVPASDQMVQTCCWDAIGHELSLKSGHQQYQVPVECLRMIPEALSRGAGQLTVTVGRIGKNWSVLDIEPGDTSESNFGIAVDLGTTTVVTMLVDLNQGRVLKKASSYNQQIRTADDVASRISYCRSAEDVRHLQRLVVQDTINELIQTICDELAISANRISRIAVSGNTVMTHLLLGISPESIGRLPFRPVANSYSDYRARDLQLDINPLGIVDVIPSVSGYVGGDIVSDIYVARLSDRGEPTLLVDIGTNGEIVYAEEGRYIACATAAGPAFEGYGTAHGCRAATGAIEHIHFGGNLKLEAFETRVIGGGPASGLCGSALIDFIACGIRSGLINRMGRYNLEQLRDAGRYLGIEQMCGVIHACVVVPADQSANGEAIYVSEADVAQILKAKAAIYAGIKTLLEVRNKSVADISRFCLAGGFARHIHLQNAILIGLLPDLPLDRFDVIGNGSLAGAMLALVDADAMDAYQTIAKLPEVVELNREASFESNFIDALALPNLNAAEFPNVTAEIAAALSSPRS